VIFEGRQFEVSSRHHDQIARIIEDRSRSLGFDVSLAEMPNDEIAVNCVRSRPWHWFLTHRSLQHVTWRVCIETTQQATSVVYDRRWFKWYRSLMLALAIPVGFAWFLGLRLFIRQCGEPAAFDVLSIIAPWVGTLGMLGYASVILAVEGSTRYLDRIRRALREEGYLLVARPTARADRVTWAGLTLLLYALVGAGAALVGPDVGLHRPLAQAQMWGLVIVSLLLAFLVLALIALCLAIRRVGSDDRFAALMPSLWWMMALLFFMAGQLPLHWYGTAGAETWESAFQARAIARAQSPAEDSGATRRLARDFVARLRGALALGALLIPLCWSIGLGFARASIRSADLAQRICRRLQDEARSESTRVTTSGVGFLRTFKAVYAAMWILFVALATIGQGLLLSMCIGVFGAASSPDVNTVDASISAMALLAGLDPASPTLSTCLKGLLIAWACLLPLAILASLLDLARRSWRRKALLGRAGRIKEWTIQSDEYTQLIESLSQRADDCRLQVLVTNDSRYVAAAHYSILRSTTSVVEVSDATLEVLQPEELKAIIAHELAHHVAGHCRKIATLRLLGRLTLVGDTFVGALANSFGYEVEADRIAIERFGIPARSLRSALLKMQIGMLMGSEVHQTGGHEDRPYDVRGASDEMETTSRRTIRSSVRAWVALYTRNPPLSYWHPSIRERLCALERYPIATRQRPAERNE